jgi:hypothetical protein
MLATNDDLVQLTNREGSNGSEACYDYPSHCILHLSRSNRACASGKSESASAQARLHGPDVYAQNPRPPNITSGCITTCNHTSNGLEINNKISTLHILI